MAPPQDNLEVCCFEIVITQGDRIEDPLNIVRELARIQRFRPIQMIYDRLASPTADFFCFMTQRRGRTPRLRADPRSQDS